MMKSSHFFTTKVNWATPLMYMTMASVFLIVVQKVFADYLMKWGFTMSSKEIKVDEDLPNFFKAVKLSHADELVLENDNMEKNYFVMPNDPDTIDVLNATKIPKKAIQGTPWYQILSNHAYSHQFQYIGAFVNEREKLIEDGYPESKDPEHAEEERQIRCEQSDMIVILLNLAYIPDSVITGKGFEDGTNWDFNFENGWQFYFKRRMNEYIDHFNQKVAQGVVVPRVDESGAVIGAPATYDVQWKFQDEELEERYKAFKDRRDQELHVQRTEGKSEKPVTSIN